MTNPIIDQKTPYLGLPLLHPDNYQEDDVPRIRAAFLQLDQLHEQISQALQALAATIAEQQQNIAGKVDAAPGLGLSERNYSESDQAKLAGVAAGATANASDAQLRDRAQHTGTQAIATIEGLSAALDDLSQRIAALSAGQTITDLGAVATAAAETVEVNIGSGRFFTASMAAANTTGTLTLNFTNLPDDAGAAVTWHVELIRGGRKVVAFQQDGVAFTPTWASGTAPTLGSGTTSRELLMFYRMPGRTKVYAMLVDSGVL